MSERLAVPRSGKLFIGGEFCHSECGRSAPITDSEGKVLATVALGSREDALQAVAAARSALKAWSAATPYQRGQALYGVAELLESQRTRFVADLCATEELAAADAGEVVDAAVDRWIWYAGWPDKLAQLHGRVSPVAGPYVAASTPRPVGIVAVLAPQDSSLVGLVSVLAPALAGGNTVVALASEWAPLPAVALGELLAASELPSGAVNILTGCAADLAPALVGHPRVDAVDLAGAPDDSVADLQVAATVNLTRVFPPAAADWSAVPEPDRMLAFVESQTVWQSIGV
jgi:acyl-CoA reductase-like NAD-dependent aldehyde dehydrogenase